MFTGAEGGVYRPAAADDLLLQLLLMCELGANWEPNERTVPLKPRGSRRKGPYGGNRNTRLADHTRLVFTSPFTIILTDRIRMFILTQEENIFIIFMSKVSERRSFRGAPEGSVDMK